MQAEKGRVHEGAALSLARLLMAFHDLWNVLPEALFQVIQAPLSITSLTVRHTARAKYSANAWQWLQNIQQLFLSLLGSCSSHKCSSPFISQHRQGNGMEWHYFMARSHARHSDRFMTGMLAHIGMLRNAGRRHY